ncbi:MAG: LamG-like jellyroll fold domain-containing protein [Pseudomonadota bacterium]
MKKLVVLFFLIFLVHHADAAPPTRKQCWDDGSGQPSCIYIDQVTRALMYQRYNEEPIEISTGSGEWSGTETDPVVAAIEGVVAASGGNIFPASAQDIINTLSGEQISTQYLLASGTTLPSICSVGEQFVDTDTSPYGFFCTGLDIWNGSIKTVISRYGFDPSALTTDAMGVNTPVNNGVGDASGRADFSLSDGDYFEWADATLSSDFPFKSGTSNTSGTFFVDVEIKSLPTAAEGYAIISKFNNATNSGPFIFGVRNSNDTWRFRQQYAAGFTTITCPIVPIPGRIYRTAVSYNGSTNSVLIMVYDTVLESLVDFDPETSGTQNWQHTFAEPMVLDSTPLRLGAYAEGDAYLSGYLDNFCVYNVAMTADEILAKFLRQGL